MPAEWTADPAIGVRRTYRGALKWVQRASTKRFKRPLAVALPWLAAGGLIAVTLWATGGIQNIGFWLLALFNLGLSLLVGAFVALWTLGTLSYLARPIAKLTRRLIELVRPEVQQWIVELFHAGVAIGIAAAFYGGTGIDLAAPGTLRLPMENSNAGSFAVFVAVAIVAAGLSVPIKRFRRVHLFAETSGPTSTDLPELTPTSFDADPHPPSLAVSGAPVIADLPEVASTRLAPGPPLSSVSGSMPPVAAVLPEVIPPTSGPSPLPPTVSDPDAPVKVPPVARRPIPQVPWNVEEPNEEFWSPTPVAGWRVWRWNGQYLRGMRELWPQANHTARCLTCQDIPGWSHTCGIYAVIDLAHLRVFGAGSATIIGRVELSGLVIEHDYGYRATRARIVELWVPQLISVTDAISWRYPDVTVHRQPLSNERNRF